MVLKIEKDLEFQKSKIGWIPSDWSAVKLKELLKYVQPTAYITKAFVQTGRTPVLTANKAFILGYSDNDQNRFSSVPVIIFDDFTMNSKYVDFPFLVRSSALKILVPKSTDVSLKYVYEAMKMVRLASTDHKRHWISEFRFLDVPLPSLPEQQKISQILTTFDVAIQLNTSLLKSLILRRMGLEQGLMSGKTRFKRFVNSEGYVKEKFLNYPKDWLVCNLSDLVDRDKRKLIPIPNEKYQQIGIRSHCKGIFHKEPVQGKDLGNKSVFWIAPDCFVVNIVFAWEHAISKTTVDEQGMIASHRFPMYRPKEGKVTLDYLLYYFQTKYGKHLLGLASPGGAGRNKTLGQSEFMKLKIPVPSISEQEKITGFIREANEEIILLKEKISLLTQQKRGVMQQLLTGKTRVTVND